MKIKKILFIFVACIFLSGCTKNKQNIESSAQKGEELTVESSDESTIKLDDMGGEFSEIVISPEKSIIVFEEMLKAGDEYIDRITIFEAESNEWVQTIEESTAVERCNSNDGHLLFSDINFDGNVDLHFIIDESMGNVIYTHYLWDDKENKFVYIDFDSNGGFVVDNEKQIVETTMRDTNYSGIVEKFKWDGEKFVSISIEEYDDSALENE